MTGPALVTDLPGLGSRRAAALPADQRREMIAAATLALLLEHGAKLTTKQIAEAAGVAEGTIFRVFPDKDAVVRAAVELAFDPAPTERALEQIDGSCPFEDQVVEAVEIIQRRMADVGRLVSAAGGPAVLAVRDRPVPDHDALTALFERQRKCLACTPARAARLLLALTLALKNPALHGNEPMTAPDIASLLLHGIGARPSRSPSRPQRGRSC